MTTSSSCARIAATIVAGGKHEDRHREMQGSQPRPLLGGEQRHRLGLPRLHWRIPVTLRRAHS